MAPQGGSIGCCWFHLSFCFVVKEFFIKKEWMQGLITIDSPLKEKVPCKNLRSGERKRRFTFFDLISFHHNNGTLQHHPNRMSAFSLQMGWQEVWLRNLRSLWLPGPSHDAVRNEQNTGPGDLTRSWKLGVRSSSSLCFKVLVRGSLTFPSDFAPVQESFLYVAWPASYLLHKKTCLRKQSQDFKDFWIKFMRKESAQMFVGPLIGSSFQ